MMTSRIEKAAALLIEMTDAERTAFVESLMIGVFLKARERGRLVEQVASLCGFWGLHMIHMDHKGVKQGSCFNTSAPSLDHVKKLLDLIGDATTPAIDRYMQSIGGDRTKG